MMGLLKWSRVPLAVVMLAGTSACLKTEYTGKASGERRSVRGFMPVEISTFQSQQRSDWKIDSEDSKLLSTSRTLQFGGRCERGVSKVRAVVVADQSSFEASCLTGTFSLEVVLTSDGSLELDFFAVTLDGSLRSEVFRHSILVDTVAPNPPRVLTNFGRRLASLTHSVVLEGTVSSDTVELHAIPGGTVTLDPVHRTFDFPVALPEGQTSSVASISFVAVDKAGNESESTRMLVSFGADIGLAGGEIGLSSLHSGAPIASAGVSEGTLESGTGHSVGMAETTLGSGGHLAMGYAQMTADLDVGLPD